MSNYGDDVSVYVEDIAGDLGAPDPPGKVWWLSPDVDIPSHSGEAVQGSNDVQIRVHCQDEPVLDDKIVAEVYVCKPSLGMSPVTASKRIDPGNLLFRQGGSVGTEPVADVAGGTVSFPWTPTANPADVDGVGHRCLVVRAFPQSVAPPTVPFDVPNEQHEAQHNIEVLSTTTAPGDQRMSGGGTPHDPRRRDEKTGLWWEQLATLAGFRPGRRFVVLAIDPSPTRHLSAAIRRALRKANVSGFAQHVPGDVTLEPVGGDGEQIDPHKLIASAFGEAAGLGRGVFAAERLAGAAALDLEPDRSTGLDIGLALEKLDGGTALALHAAQWNERGQPEGGMTVIALPPTGR